MAYSIGPNVISCPKRCQRYQRLAQDAVSLITAMRDLAVDYKCSRVLCPPYCLLEIDFARKRALHTYSSWSHLVGLDIITIGASLRSRDEAAERAGMFRTCREPVN